MKFAVSTILLGLAAAAQAYTVTSPDGNIGVDLKQAADGALVYSVEYKGKPIVTDSHLGLKADEAQLDKVKDLKIETVGEFDETWTPVWGQYDKIRSHYNEAVAHVTAADAPGLKLDIRFRVFDDGLGFRYEMPVPQEANYLTLRDELTEFNMGDDYTMWFIPGDYDTDEFLYTTTPMSQLAQNFNRPRHSESSASTGLNVQTPLMLKSPDGVYVSLHEAALVGYPAMSLDVNPEKYAFKSHLTPDKLGVSGYLKGPFVTPWRTLVISDDARDILASSLILNLNEPCAIEDTSWITPQKFMGVWWEMFTGTGKTWAYSDDWNAQPGVTDYSKLPSNGRHPANNDNVKKYIDFAAESGIPAVLVEGWNEGWEDWGGYRKNRQFLFDKPYPDFDPDMLQQYAASKGVKLIMHHETAANAADYERQLDRAFQYMVDHGYNSVKTGYVGHIIPRSEFHSSQWMVDHFLHVAKRAADYKIMVDSHEAVRPTGLCRTWPNWVAQESARGGEWESMGGNTPEHTVILPFTRLMGGPMDYTPGLFETRLSYYTPDNEYASQGGTTMMKQLALYLTMPSPLQMACDLPENYQRFPDAFQFIKDVPVDWKNSVYLEAEPGDYITVARQDKNSDDWYIGAITDENARRAEFKLDFLTPGVKYRATIYQDGKDADWKDNPQSYEITERDVNSKTTLRLNLAPGGGAAVRLVPVK